MEDVKRAVDDLRLKTAAYVVEATDEERHLLWLHHSAEAKANRWGLGDVQWSGRGGHGWLVPVGELAGFPVNMTVTFDTICGRPVIFWAAVSRVVDYDMCREWLEKHVPAYRDHHCNTANFGHCLAHLLRTPTEPSSS